MKFYRPAERPASPSQWPSPE
uniref:Uncharacterized protein n=1 Tax=Anguilla anguilla TaxID=7936 RepID=A0A0E9R7M7_ANGAN